MSAEASVKVSLDELSTFTHLTIMSVLNRISRTASRARYTAAQSVRSAWYGGQYFLARRQSAGFTRPGEPPFKPDHAPKMKALRQAYFDLFRKDRENIERGLYPDPVGAEMSISAFPSTLRRARAFLKDVSEVDRRRLARDGTEVRRDAPADLSRFPPYYRQNFHYQTDGWLSDESADIYDHQVEALFTGAAAAMRRAVLAEIALELRGHDQRQRHVLDLACGTGRFLQAVLRAYPRVNLTGLDLSPAYAARARDAVARWPNATVAEGQAEELPFADGAFDTVASIYLFHELPPKIRPRVMAEAARVLKPGGAFVIADSLQFGDVDGLDGFLEYFPEGFHEPYYKGYLEYDFEPDMHAAGFVSERIEHAFLTKVRVWRKGERSDG